MKKIKDTDYLSVSTRVRAMETRLLTRERLDQILDAHTPEDVSKILQECGYPDLDPARPDEMDAALVQIRRETFEDLSDSLPDPRLIDAFRLPYDYHNAKAVLKGNAVGTDPAHMLMNLGRMDAAALREATEQSDWDALPEILGAAIAEAKEVLDTTRDPQLSDMVLDRRMYEDLSALAEEIGSDFLCGYVRTQIDAANLRSLVRTLRMGRNAEFLRGAVFSGGDIDPEDILTVSANGGTGLAELFDHTPLQSAAEAGADALRGGPLTRFEKLCDDAVTAYLDRAALIPFGDAPVTAYLAARETEYANVRIALMGRGAGLPADVIRARLRGTGT